MSRLVIRTVSAASLLVLCMAPWFAYACPFCSSTSQTLSEEIAAADVVMVAKLLSVPQAVEPNKEDIGTFGLVDPDSGKANFRIVEVLKGKENASIGDEIEVIFYGEPDPEASYMITGLGSPSPDWTTPLPLSPVSRAYLEKLPGVAEKGNNRLVFFQDYLQHKDPMLAQDAYDEFARAPYDQVVALKDQMRPDRLVEWIGDPEVPPSRKRLYLRLLGVCGGADDLAMLESMIRSDDQKVKRAFDATIACYLILKGPEGLPLVEELFLKDAKADYQDTYAAVVALRFHGEAVDVIPRERLLVAMRHLLDHPDLADQIIPDLARWEDWSVRQRLVDLFKNSTEQSKWVRVPIISYLQECGRQEGEIGREALAAIDELAKIDPDAVDRAKSYFAFGSRAGSRPAASKQQTEQTATSVETTGDAQGADTKANAESATDSAETATADSTAEPEESAAVVGAPADDGSSGNAADTSLVETIEESPLPGPLLIVGGALAAGLVLLVLLWVILRGAGAHKPARS